MILRKFLSIPLCMLLIILPAHAAKVYVEFEGIVTGISDNEKYSLNTGYDEIWLPNLQLGDIVKGSYVINPDQAPIDNSPFDPSSGRYYVDNFNPAPSTFIEATIVIDGITFRSNERNDTTQRGGIDVFDGDEYYDGRCNYCDSYAIYEEESGNGTGFDLDINFSESQTELSIDMVKGESIEQSFAWSIEPNNTNPNFGDFYYSNSEDLDNINVLFIKFGLTKFQVGTTQPLLDLSGAVKTEGGQDICAMVLASGQYTFSCNPIGQFSLTDLPRENDGTLKRQIYAQGFFPKIDILTDSANDVVTMTRSGTCPSYNTPDDPVILPGSAGKRINISGRVLLQDSQTPICAMVLANGQYTFSCDGTGSYNLDIPLDNNGQYKLQVYAQGFAPTIQRFDEFSSVNNVRMARAAECQ